MRWIALAAFVFVLFTPPIAAPAAPSLARRCAQLASIITDEVDVHAPNKSDGTWFDAKMWSLSANDFKQDAADYKAACKPGDPNEQYVAGYLAAWEAALLHANRDAKWRDDLNLSDQLLSRCVVRYHGTMKAARCDTQLQRNTKNLVAWDRDD